MENDENKYMENHSELVKEIYNKDIYYIKKNIDKLILKYKILGYY